MSTITIIDNQYVTLWFHEDTGIVHHVYRHGIGGDYLKEALMRGTDYLIERKAFKWLSDNRDIEGVTDEESQWIDTVWLPRTMEAGWKYWALVVPESVMGRMNMIQFIESFANHDVMVRVFTDPDKAMDWLINVDKQAQPQSA
ncbi:MAG: hypothetical protein CUN51_01620 [Candidatus Thermofonsia Clade 1 bacterium]|uniref:STAS/SEC14 domain-containing protein n=1 Tax=Candidatus Thermofonsia Clade 1 bacterium TaxID=2364210 RepID=A0A2M8P488_9CHLR|nr:MAG: hypothetical protein CUN51_01620 [Candidatus Thermofonsia Clade 1 bacterium]